ncbi:MAG: cobalt ECF transporter T component CbiQ [Anaerolineales bacterium]|nr:cobalt ECF transporter T component CbiQ [Anaerolineales bacterium]
MRLIDTYAYANRLRRFDPALKVGLTLWVILLCLTLNRPLVSAATLAWMLALGMVWAGLPARVVLKLLFVEGMFLLLGVLGIIVTAGLEPPVGPTLQIGPLWLAVSPEAVGTALALVGRSLGCAAALNLLALTTPLVDLITLGRRLHVPELLLDLMTLTYRFIFTLLECLERMRLAQEARLGYATPHRALSSAAWIAANLLTETLRRSRQLQLALECRGWEGRLRVLPGEYVCPRHTGVIALLVTGTLIAAWSWR